MFHTLYHSWFTCFLTLLSTFAHSFCARPVSLSQRTYKKRLFLLAFSTILGNIPNSESVGFQSLGPGTGDTKMHAPKNRSSLGTLLEPFAVGLQSWNNLQALLLQGKKPNKTCQKFTCEIICMLLHEHLRHLSTSVLTRTLSFSENHNFRTPVLQLYLLDLCFTTVAWLSEVYLLVYIHAFMQGVEASFHKSSN